MQWSVFAISRCPSKSSKTKLTDTLPKCRHSGFVLSANRRIPLFICHLSEIVDAMKTMAHMWNHEVAAAIHGNLALDFGGFSLCESYVSTWGIELVIDTYIRFQRRNVLPTSLSQLSSSFCEG